MLKAWFKRIFTPRTTPSDVAMGEKFIFTPDEAEALYHLRNSLVEHSHCEVVELQMPQKMVDPLAVAITAALIEAEVTE